MGANQSNIEARTEQEEKKLQNEALTYVYDKLKGYPYLPERLKQVKKLLEKLQSPPEGNFDFPKDIERVIEALKNEGSIIHNILLTLDYRSEDLKFLRDYIDTVLRQTSWSIRQMVQNHYEYLLNIQRKQEENYKKRQEFENKKRQIEMEQEQLAKAQAEKKRKEAEKLARPKKAQEYLDNLVKNIEEDYQKEATLHREWFKLQDIHQFYRPTEDDDLNEEIFRLLDAKIQTWKKNYIKQQEKIRKQKEENSKLSKQRQAEQRQAEADKQREADIAAAHKRVEAQIQARQLAQRQAQIQAQQKVQRAQQKAQQALQAQQQAQQQAPIAPAAPLALPLQAKPPAFIIEDLTLNRFIERYIGAPIPLYSPVNDHVNQRVCALYRPAIHKFYSLCNTFDQNEVDIKYIMNAILNSRGGSWIQKLQMSGLIPISNPSENLVDTWFNYLFSSNNEYRPRLVVQGGEAVNFYTKYKYQNVLTHDVDTRILIGYKFNYSKTIDDVRNESPEACRKMHMFRFFVSYGLSIFLHIFHGYIQQNLSYAEKVLSESNISSFYLQAFVKIYTSFGQANLVDLIENNQYDSKDDNFIGTLMNLYVNLDINGSPLVPTYPLVDLFIPQKLRAPGHSDNIHRYFSTEQAKSVSVDPQRPLVWDYQVPFMNIELVFPQGIPWLGNKTFTLTIVPYGYLIFDTIRMLIVSAAKDEAGHDNKFMKYKQKLNVLFGTLIDTDFTKTNQDIIQYCNTFKRGDSKHYISGGRRVLPKEDNSLGTADTMTPKTILVPQYNKQAPKKISKEIQEAKVFSKKFLAEGAPLTFQYETFSSPAEEKGYFNYLSYRLPEYMDYRLPLSKEEYGTPIEFNSPKAMLTHLEKVPIPLNMPKAIAAYGGSKTRKRKHKRKVL